MNGYIRYTSIGHGAVKNSKAKRKLVVESSFYRLTLNISGLHFVLLQQCLSRLIINYIITLFDPQIPRGSQSELVTRVSSFHHGALE